MDQPQTGREGFAERLPLVRLVQFGNLLYHPDPRRRRPCGAELIRHARPQRGIDIPLRMRASNVAANAAGWTDRQSALNAFSSHSPATDDGTTAAALP
jgi:hypothetical protein